MFDNAKNLCSWLLSWISLHIFSPMIEFHKSYPEVRGNPNICSYLRKQNDSVYMKHAIFTVGFSMELFGRFAEKMAQTGSIIETLKIDAFFYLHALLRIAALIYASQFKAQIKSTSCRHNIEAQRSIRLKLHVCTISRIISNSLLACDFLYGKFEADSNVSFAWVMGLLDTLITVLWFIDTPYMKIVILFGHNANYCLLGSTKYLQFKVRLMEKIIIPCMLLSILVIAYDMSVKSNFILRRHVKEQKIVIEKFLEKVQDPIMIYDKTHLIFGNNSAKTKFGLTYDLCLEKLDKLKSNSMKSLNEELKERLSGNECNLEATEVKFFLYENKETVDVAKPEKVFMVTIVESEFFARCKTVSLILRDITLEIEQEEKRFEDRLRNMMLYSLAHELRTPLNFLLDVFDLAKPSNISKENKERFDNCKGAWNYLRNKINDTLTYAQILSGELEIHNSAFNFGKFVKQLQKMSKFLLHDKRKKVIFSLNIDSTNIISNDFIGDRERLEEILFNIMQYSIRNTDSGIIELSLKHSENQIAIELKDTGCGMPDKNISEILQDSKNRLLQISGLADAKINKITNYSTLGLSTSNIICKKMGGKFEIESVVGKGSTFRLILPLKLSPKTTRNSNLIPKQLILDKQKNEDESPNISQFSAEENANINKPYFLEHNTFSSIKALPIQKIKTSLPILVVDDNDFNRVVVKKMISKYTDNIEEAENGEAAISKFTTMASQNSKILIFMDLDMPIMGGIEATRKIRELKLTHRPYITALTSFATEVERKACFEVNMDWFLSKPLTKNNLEEVLAKFNNE